MDFFIFVLLLHTELTVRGSCTERFPAMLCSYKSCWLCACETSSSAALPLDAKKRKARWRRSRELYGRRSHPHG